MTLVGTLLQVLAGVVGVDLPMDVRDFVYDVTNFEFTREHIVQTLLDAVAILPVVGGLKHVDEAADVIKAGTKSGKKMTAKEATEAAKALGFKPTKEYSHGQPVFKKGNRYISPDVDSHNGGVWKMADSVKNLYGVGKRMGTYDENLNRIKD